MRTYHLSLRSLTLQCTCHTPLMRRWMRWLSSIYYLSIPQVVINAFDPTYFWRDFHVTRLWEQNKGDHWFRERRKKIEYNAISNRSIWSLRIPNSKVDCYLDSLPASRLRLILPTKSICPNACLLCVSCSGTIVYLANSMKYCFSPDSSLSGPDLVYTTGMICGTIVFLRYSVASLHVSSKRW